jgi:hypothetical protein
MNGQKRFIASLKKFLPPPSGVEPPKTAAKEEGWTEFKIRQLEARQQWLQRLLFLIVVTLLAETLGTENVKKLLALIP